MSSNELPYLPGEPYFIVMFDDEAMKIPVIQTVLFLKATKSKDGREGFLFKRLVPSGDPEKIFLETENAQHLVRDRDRFMATLQRTFDGTIDKPPAV